MDLCGFRRNAVESWRVGNALSALPESIRAPSGFHGLTATGARVSLMEMGRRGGRRTSQCVSSVCEVRRALVVPTVRRRVT